jgi:hypothetical protein
MRSSIDATNSTTTPLAPTASPRQPQGPYKTPSTVLASSPRCRRHKGHTNYCLPRRCSGKMPSRGSRPFRGTERNRIHLRTHRDGATDERDGPPQSRPQITDARMNVNVELHTDGKTLKKRRLNARHAHTTSPHRSLNAPHRTKRFPHHNRKAQHHSHCACLQSYSRWTVKDRLHNAHAPRQSSGCSHDRQSRRLPAPSWEYGVDGSHIRHAVPSSEAKVPAGHQRGAAEPEGHTMPEGQRPEQREDDIPATP